MKRLLILAALFYAASALAEQGGDPIIGFEGQNVRVTNLSPHSDVAIFAIGLVPDGFEPIVYRWTRVVPADEGGGAQFDAGQRVPCKSIWAAVNTTNGHYALAAPPPCSIRQTAIDSKNLKHGRTKSIDTFVQRQPFVDLLYVMPGAGVYTLSARDGNPADDDGQSDGLTAISLARMTSLKGEPKQNEFRPGGVLISIDLYSMGVSALRLDGAILQGVQ